MKRILICIECLDYNYIQEVQPPNLLKLDSHPAVSFGLGSRPAAAALMGGMLPVCQIPECYHRKLREIWSNPFFLTCIKEKTEKQFYLNPNGWIIEILLPWMDEEQRKLNFYWHDHHEILPSKYISEYFLSNKDKYKSYFAYLHLFESHYPFRSPSGTGDRKSAVLFLDEIVGRILREASDAEIVVTSDHNIPPRQVSAAMDVPAPKTMLCFIACNDNAKNGELWGRNAHEVAKEKWLSETKQENV